MIVFTSDLYLLLYDFEYRYRLRIWQEKLISKANIQQISPLVLWKIEDTSHSEIN